MAKSTTSPKSVTCPQERRTSERRKALNKIYSSKEWKESVKKFIAGKSCEWCGAKEKLLAHHPYIESYADKSYEDLYLSGCMVLCNRCHFSLHHGLILCKRCHSRYHGVGADMCKSCWLELHPEIVVARKKNKDDMRALQKKMRDDSKMRTCLAEQSRRSAGCKVDIPTKSHCKDCLNLGDYAKKKRPKLLPSKSSRSSG